MSVETASVIFYNRQKGFGFLRNLETDEELFVHVSYLNVEDSNVLKTLNIGEYVEFEAVTVKDENSSSNDKRHAKNVTGLRRGKLMCEAKYDMKTKYAKAKESSEETNQQSTDL